MNGTSSWLAIASLTGLLGVTISLLLSLTEGLRRNRIGVTLLACWAVLALTFFALKAVGEPLPRWLYETWLWPAGFACVTWALWDVSRLARLYGTTTLMSAADIARGFLHSPEVDAAAWATWARHLPTAAWVKGPQGVMIAINRHYESRYGKPAAAYVGAADSEKWTQSVADAFAENDASVFRLGTPVVVREPTPTWDNPNCHGLILKFPVRDARGTIVGVGGIELTHSVPHEQEVKCS